MSRLSQILFKLRGITPIPFVILLTIQSDMRWLSTLFGFCLAVVGETIRLFSVRAAGGRTRTRKVGAKTLVTNGPFGYVRNPLYLGNIMIYLGMALFAGGSWLPWLIPLALAYFIFQYALIISLEEETLINLFGDEYRQYCAHVPRLFPRFTLWRRPQEAPPPRNWCKVLRTERTTLIFYFLFTIAIIIKEILV